MRTNSEFAIIHIDKSFYWNSCLWNDLFVTTLCLKKNDSDVAHYNFNAHQPILVIIGRNIAERICY